LDSNYRETVMMARSTDPKTYQTVRAPIAVMAKDYAGETEIGAHAHARAQLVYATAGAVRVTTPVATWIVPPSCAVYIPPLVEHATATLGPVQLRTLYIAASLAKRSLSPEPRAVAVSAFLRELILRALHVPLHDEPDATARRIFGLIVDELRAQPALSLVLPVGGDAFEELCDGLLRDLARLPTVEAVARSFNVSEKTFRRRFAEATGMTFGAWCRRARVLASVARLGAGEPVTTVALDLGYASPSAFTAMFRRELGAPPTRYLRSR
jgi:AraC-like DNA-binding protein